VVAGGGAHGDELAGAADLREDRADVGDPAQRFEGDVAGVADDHDALEPARGAVVAASLALVANAVVDDEVASFDVELEAVAVGDDDACGQLSPCFRTHHCILTDQARLRREFETVHPARFR
jgi:hypothetical protein